MKVYHGSNCDIEEIDLTKGSRYKDFGRGFYVTPDFDTAKRMAEKKTRFYGGEPIVIEYEFDETAIGRPELQVLNFPAKATADWIRFIAKNRDRSIPVSDLVYDIVKGPIADDGVALQLGRLKVHAEQADAIALDLQDKYLDQQIYFGTPRSLTYLHKISVCKIQ